MVTGLPYHLVDVFTRRQFGGNQLAVFPYPGELSQEEMQRIANEMNLSETTFVLPPENPADDCRVRIFTPRVELPMAGHPTIGTAYVLLEHGLVTPKHEGSLQFEEGVGTIRVEFEPHGPSNDIIFMTQMLPSYGAVFDDREALAEMLSVSPGELAAGYPAQAISCGVSILLVFMRDLEALRSASPRLEIWEKCLHGFETREVMAFTTETEEVDSTVHSRFFGPALGIIEDPATGAASGPLGCYLVRHEIVRGRDAGAIVSEQGYELGRQSRIHIDIAVNDGEVTRVRVGGTTTPVAEGLLHLRRQ